jgi:hypothetical protein
MFGNADFFHDILRHLGRLGSRVREKFRNSCGDLFQLQIVVDFHIADGRFGQRGSRGFHRILHDGYPAAAFDGRKSADTVSVS